MTNRNCANRVQHKPASSTTARELEFHTAQRAVIQIRMRFFKLKIQAICEQTHKSWWKFEGLELLNLHLFSRTDILFLLHIVCSAYWSLKCRIAMPTQTRVVLLLLASLALATALVCPPGKYSNGASCVCKRPLSFLCFSRIFRCGLN